MAKEAKTNAMRMLERAKVPYKALTYSADDGGIDGISIATKMGEPFELVYKTLVTKGHSGNHFVFVIPVAEELDLKKAHSFWAHLVSRNKFQFFLKRQLCCVD